MMGVGTLAHRGASMHHRAVVPIVFFAMMFGLGGTGSLSHRVSKPEFDASLHGEASEFGYGTGVVVGDKLGNDTTSELMVYDGWGMGNMVHGFPKPFGLVSSSCPAHPLVFEGVTQDTQLTIGSFKSVAGGDGAESATSLGYTVSVNIDDLSAAIIRGMFDVPSWEWHPDYFVWGVMASTGISHQTFPLVSSCRIRNAMGRWCHMLLVSFACV